jgi:hypothetical protein
MLCLRIDTQVLCLASTRKKVGYIVMAGSVGKYRSEIETCQTLVEAQQVCLKDTLGHPDNLR